MKYKPREYQQAAHDAVIDWFRHTKSSCVVEAATGAGKSLIISMIADTLFELSKGRRVLCLAPSAELVAQNAEKFREMAGPCSIYSASIEKSLRHKVVFATEMSFKAVASTIGKEFTGVIIDEAHRISPTIKNIIGDMKKENENLRVVGLSATPYRLGDGFIFEVDLDGNPIHETQTRDPYFKRLVYSIGARELIEKGFLTPVIIGDINATSYKTEGLKTGRSGEFTKKSIEQAFEGWGRETSQIVADIVNQSADKKGVMIFASTVRHAEEIMASLPPENSRMIGGKINTQKSERLRLVNDFKMQRFKYLVSVGTMTTGVDFTHVDVVAILRATESISLMQQIIGRGMRLHESKDFCLLLDYAGNIENHCPDSDLFRPEIRAAYQTNGSTLAEFRCPDCDGLNTFSLRENKDGYDMNESGYFTDLTGEVIKGDYGPMPSHYGRRCQAQVYNRESKEYERCSYFLTHKECPSCEFKNDITARYCEQCKGELVNPNEKLIIDFKSRMKDLTQFRTEEVLQMDVIQNLSGSGNEQWVASFVTPNQVVKGYFMKNPSSEYQYRRTINFLNATDRTSTPPRTVTYKKEGKFFEISGFNKTTDEELLKEKLNESTIGAHGASHISAMVREEPPRAQRRSGGYP